MTNHTPTPWMTSPCGELAPNDVMIVGDMGKNSDGIQCISTVARALSIRQTPEVTRANAKFIVRACNSHNALIDVLERWLAFAEETLSEFDLEACENDKLCARCESAGCINLRIRDTREALTQAKGAA